MMILSFLSDFICIERLWRLGIFLRKKEITNLEWLRNIVENGAFAH